MFKKLFLASSILFAGCSTVETYHDYEVIKINQGAYLQGGNGTAFLDEADFDSTLSIGDKVSISFDQYGDISNIKRLNKKYGRD